ncbi:MAG: metallophosphoesterase, partial [Prevotella sp.]|nr:metallophosphoesterase [Prevotella sp.]
MKWRLLLLLIAAFSLTACEGVFQVHPYDVHLDGERNINDKNKAKIEAAFAQKDTLRVAFISDTHLWHSGARYGVADINGRSDIDFVIHCGDLTDTGT